MIARYTRPAMAEIWSDHARFEAMREVEVAACEEMEGPSADELEAIRADIERECIPTDEDDGRAHPAKSLTHLIRRR